MIKNKKLRWILFAVGIAAVLILTAVTVFSLFALRKNSITNQRQAKEIQVSDFADQVSRRLNKPIRKLNEVNMGVLQKSFRASTSFPKEATQILMRVSKDSLYKDIFYFPADLHACFEHKPIYQFNPHTQKFYTTKIIPGWLAGGCFLHVHEWRT